MILLYHIPDEHINIEIDLDELDLTSAECKSTYTDYVKAHTGLTVSSLNIAQVKQKCGIIERSNYHMTKSVDSKLDALRHFKMI